jgi:hypothetical protein
MKVFRGSALALALLLVAFVFVWFLKPGLFDRGSVHEDGLFSFEKHELVRVDVRRPDGTSVVLVEEEGRWIIEGSGHTAGRSMVHRVKHQIHDLTARASVVEDSDNLVLYGLGPNQVDVTLTLRGGRIIEFAVGDPNPTSVSYYIQPKGSGSVYTVQKAAVDYYSLTLDEFRERRFATFDTKDVTGFVVTVNLEDAKRTLALERAGVRQWNMSSPIEMAVDDDHARRMLGRISAMKAIRFEPREGVNLSEYGFDAPRLDVTIGFGSRKDMRMRVGAEAESDGRFESLAYVVLDDEDTLFVARGGMLKEFSVEPATMRNRRIVKMSAKDVVSIDAELAPGPDMDLSGEGRVRFVAAQWVWRDGVPVSGSTPKRVARRLAELEVVDFVDAGTSDELGLAEPRARVVLRDDQDNERVIRIGGTGEPMIDPEGHPRARFYVQVEGEGPVYLVDAGILEVIRDLVRESARKDVRDQETAARHERIESVENGAQ